MRPVQEVRRHTFENIQEIGYFTINHVHRQFLQRAHYTSAKFDKYISEFEQCGLQEEYLFGFRSPFVKESRLKLGLKFEQAIQISLNKTMLVIGKIEHIILPDEAVDNFGYIDLSRMKDVGISGQNTYYSLEKIGFMPYARPEEVPDFSVKSKADEKSTIA